MDCYTKKVTVSIKSGSPVINRLGSIITQKNIRIPIITPRPRPTHRPISPLGDLSNSMRNERLGFRKSPLSAIPISPRTKGNENEHYWIERTSSATRLYLMEELAFPSMDDSEETAEQLCESIELVHKGGPGSDFDGFVDPWNVVHA